MKTLLIILLATFTVSAQERPRQVAYASHSLDTLYVPNDEVGRALDMLWSTQPIPDTLKARPVIIYMDSYIIQDMVRTNSTRRPGVKYQQVTN